MRANVEWKWEEVVLSFHIYKIFILYSVISSSSDIHNKTHTNSIDELKTS